MHIIRGTEPVTKSIYFLFLLNYIDLRNGANCVGNRYEYVGVGVDVLRHITSWCP